MKAVYHSTNSRRVDSMMTPMIDVVFLLLVFFLATASFDRVEQVLPSGSVDSTQQSSTGGTATVSEPQATEVDEIVVRLALSPNQSLEIYLNDQAVTTQTELLTRLSALIKIRKDVPVIIDPARELPTERVIEVYDRVRSVGFTSLFLTTDKS
jgi:biopolymer transport protein ExbD